MTHTTDEPAHHTPTSPPLRRTLLVAAIVWMIPALFMTTHQWRELYGTGKHMSWAEALAYQAPSWLLLIPATPIVFAVVRRHPLRAGAPMRLAMHVLVSVLFGAAFLLVAVPTRNLVHPRPFQWEMFGNAVYKSVPQFVLMGVLAYWAITLVGSLIETRLRLHAVMRPADDAVPPNEAPRSGDAEEPPPSDAAIPSHFVLTTPAGRTRLASAEITWIEPVAGGARLHTDAGPILVRHALADLEQILPAAKFVRVHRSFMVGVDRIREVVGSPSRDGHVRLDTGELVPVSRRRRAALDEAMAVTSSAQPLGT